MIPKKIHYCWFGGNPLPDLAIRCIESWKKYCPDYEIIEWNESNFDVYGCPYVKEAYEAKKWAFVSDYARFEILNTHGGLYFDTDVELIRPIDDIVAKGSYMGQECTNITGEKWGVNPGLGMGAEAGNPVLNELCRKYRQMHFLQQDGTYDMTTIVVHTTALLQKYGFSEKHGIQNIGSFWIYPPDYFGPMNLITGKMDITDHTRSIHHYNASWSTEAWHLERKFVKKATKIVGVKLAMILGRAYSFPYRIKSKLETLGFPGMIKFAVVKVFGKRQQKT